MDPLIKWLSHFNLNETLLVLDGDNFLRRPWEELHRAQVFLGLPPTVRLRESYFARNRQTGRYCLREYFKYVRPYCVWRIRLIFPLSCRSGKVHRVCMMSHKSRNRTELSEDERERVEAFFEPYNRVRHKRGGFPPRK